MTEQPGHPFPWRITVIVVVVVAVSTVVAGLLLSRDRVGSVAPQPSPSLATASGPSSTSPSASGSASASAAAPEPAIDERGQVTVLLTVRDASRQAVSSVLIGVGGDTDYVAELLLPRDLLLPTSPPIRLQDATDPTGGQTADQPLETLLGVRVDAVVDLDRLAWTGLIDATGSRVDLAAAERPGSFPLVLDRVLSGLPADRGRIGELLTGLGSMARTTVTNEDATALLDLVGRGLRTAPVRRESLPVTYVRGGADRVAVADQQASAVVVRDLFPEALLEPGHPGQPRVVLQRAGATVGAAAAARLDLVADGFGVVVDPGVQLPATTSMVVVPAGSPEALARGEAVAEVLGLDPAAVVTSADPDATVDVRVLLAPDVPLAAP